MKKILCIVIFLSFISCDGLINWVDNDKTWWKDDRKLCWAASIANIMEYKGLGEDVFQTFKDHFTDEQTPVIIGIYWYLTGKNLKQDVPGYAQLEDTSWKGIDFGGNTIKILISEYKGKEHLRGVLLDLGVVSLNIIKNGNAHCVTAWTMIGDELIITDSDDLCRGLVARHIDDMMMAGGYTIDSFTSIRIEESVL